MYSCQQIADVVSENLGKNNIISVSTVYRVLKKNGYGTYKLIVKPGLIKAIKEARYA
jgi:DNA invertase Pin-like site-specific DNA recombinase